MGSSSKARAFALQMLFQWDIGGGEPDRIEAGFWKEARAEKSTRAQANRLFEGAAGQAAQLDALLAAHATNWRLERMAAIDRNILRLAAFELRTATTPAKVVIDEALELAKKFSTVEAGPFINGVLDAVLKFLRTE